MKASIFHSKSQKDVTMIASSTPRLPLIRTPSFNQLPALRRSTFRNTLAETKESKQLKHSGASQSLADFTILRTIGVGSFARVRLAITRSTKEVVVLKSMSKSHIFKRKQVTHVLAEKTILAQLASPFLLTLRGTFQDAYYLHLVLEYVQGGELYHLLAQKGYIDSYDARVYSAEVVCALSYLHSQSIVYRDLKPENILITTKGHIKLADFGFAKVLKCGEKTYTLCGTPEYLAPEVILNTGHDFPCDWWALGVLLCEMLTGSAPFQGSTPYLLYQSILNQKVEFPACIDFQERALISSMLCKDPDRRATENEIRGSAYFADVAWEAVAKRRLLPRHVPTVRNAVDTSHFDKYKEAEGVLDERRPTDPTTFRDF